MNKVLLIEDDDDIRENTAELLDLEGYVVVTAKNGTVGVELAKVEHPDIIICDIRMAELDGYGVLHDVKECETLKQIPFIFLTAMAEPADKRKGIEMGARDYVTKPFEFSRLLQSIQMLLCGSEMLSKPHHNLT